MNVRYDPGDDPYVNARTEMFRQVVMPKLSQSPSTTPVLNPYWGGRAAKFPWNHGALPTGGYEAFGETDNAELVAELFAIPGVDDAPADGVLLAAARHGSLDAAIDVLWTLAASGLDETAAAEWSASAAAVAAYAMRNPVPEWLATVRDDAEFVAELLARAGDVVAVQPRPAGAGVETFGRIANAARAMTRAASRLGTAAAAAVAKARAAGRRTGDAAVLRLRTPAHKTIITFLGDMLAYFHQRHRQHQDIADVILADFDRAAAASAATAEPLIVVGHSMGGIIMYDLLTSVRSDVPVNVFVSVGSQIAVIEEQKLFAASQSTIPSTAQPKVPRPANVARWINVFDTRDILGFPAGAVFDGVEDYMFATGRLWAHSGYFVEPMFHQRLAARI